MSQPLYSVAPTRQPELRHELEMILQIVAHTGLSDEEKKQGVFSRCVNALAEIYEATNLIDVQASAEERQMQTYDLAMRHGQDKYLRGVELLEFIQAHLN